MPGKQVTKSTKLKREQRALFFWEDRFAGWRRCLGLKGSWRDRPDSLAGHAAMWAWVRRGWGWGEVGSSRAPSLAPAELL